jgi:hemolysin III
MHWLDLREPVSALTHGTWLALTPFATAMLLRAANGHRRKQIGFLVFGLTMAVCYAASMLFHSLRLPADELQWFALADFIGIYLFIAGSVTPAALVVLDGAWRRGAVAVTWGLAATGIGLRLGFVGMPRELSTALYLGMGWCVLVCYFRLARRTGHKRLWPALLGGVLYSVGAVLNLIQWPVIYPGTIEAHEVFHLFVMGGTSAHFLFMLRVVAPFAADMETSAVPAAVPRTRWAGAIPLRRQLSRLRSAS